MTTTIKRYDLDGLYTQVMIEAMGLVIMAEGKEESDRSKIAFTDIKDHGNGIWTGYNPKTGQRERIANPTLKQKAEAEFNKLKDSATETAANVISSLEQLQKAVGDPKEAVKNLSSQVMSIADQKAMFGNISIKPEVAIQAIQKNYNQVTKSVEDVFTKLVPKEQQEAFVKEFEKLKEDGKQALANGKQAVEQFVAQSRVNIERARIDAQLIDRNVVIKDLAGFALGSFVGSGLVMATVPSAAVVLSNPYVAAGMVLSQSLLYLSRLVGAGKAIDQAIVSDLVSKFRVEAEQEILKQFEEGGLELPDSKQLNTMVTNLLADKLASVK